MSMCHEFGSGRGSAAPDSDVLGGKGAGLMAMADRGLPVPPGFVIGTAAGRAYLAGGALPAGLTEEIGQQLSLLESRTGRRFGAQTDPLLVSVRSGAPVSMPGMMDTILNVGLTMASARSLGDRTNRLFAWTSMQRLLDAFARTVRGISGAQVEEALMDLGAVEESADCAQVACHRLLELIEAESGRPFPAPEGQLSEAITAVFDSWHSRRAVAYRKHRGIDESMGTAVVVQSMVFGNRDAASGSGVAFTRDPATGRPGHYGDFLFLAQGEDVVAGERDTAPLSVLQARLPAVHAELAAVLDSLERSARDLCDVEFTVESGQLWVLQTRVGQRTGRAAVRLAVDLVEEGLISVEEALGRVDDEQLAAARAARFPGEPQPEHVLGDGVPASPGVACGIAAFDVERAQQLAASGRSVILIRPTTSPADLPGVLASSALATGRGGRTSHAAVVARGLQRPAVCGMGEVEIAGDSRSARLNGVAVHEGEEVAVDGDRGILRRGNPEPVRSEELDPSLRRFLAWREKAGAR